MAIKALSILKSYFFPTAKPTGDQFHDVLDSYRHKSDMIPLSDIDGMDTLPTGVMNAELTTDPADYPNVFIFNISEAGTYTAFPDADDDPGHAPLEVTSNPAWVNEEDKGDLEKGMVQFRKFGDYWGKYIVPVSASATGSIADNDKNAVSGDTVFDYVVANLVSETSLTKTTVPSENNLLDRSYLVLDKTINSSGVVVDFLDCAIIQNHPIATYAGQSVTFDGFVQESLKKLVFRDVGGNAVSGVISLTTLPITRTVPDEAVTFDMVVKRQTDASNSYDQLRMSPGSVSLPYEPFSTEVITKIRDKKLTVDANGKVEEGDVRPVSGAAVLEYIADNALTTDSFGDTIIYSEKNKLDRAYIAENKSINSSGVVNNSSPGNNILQNHPIAAYAGQSVTFDGFVAPDSLKKLVFRDGLGAVVGAVFSLNALPYTIAVPVGAVTFDMSIKRGTDTVEDYAELRMSPGAVSFPYEPFSESYVSTVLGKKIFADKSNESESGGGGVEYDQSLNTTDEVEFQQVTADRGVFAAMTVNLPTGAGSPPPEVAIGDAWIDTTTGNQKVRLS